MEISVIMSVYDTEIEYLQQAIESILEQSYRDFEFLIVDDGSKKQEVKELLVDYAYKDERIKLIVNSPNIGLTKSLNKALGQAVGKYIVRMDSDDISCGNRLERQYAYMEQHPEIAVLGSQVAKFGEKQESEPMYYIDYTQRDYDEFLINMMFYNVGPIHPTVMLRKQFLDENGVCYNEQILKAQDYALWIDCINKGGKIYNLPEVLLKYRVHENQITSKNFGEQYRFIQQITKSAIRKQGFEVEEADEDLLIRLYSEEYVVAPKKYVRVLKRLISINREKNIFEPGKFKKVIGVRWLHKVIKCSIKGHDFRGFFCSYTWRCIFSGSMLSWIKYHLLPER